MSDTITIVGVVGTDPERKNPKGVPITTFRVATKDRRFDRATGAWTDGDTNWYTVSAYRKLAEHVFDSVHKRDRVILTGRLRVRSWETGESRGTAVDIDLDAIGHELLWGTTVFTRDDRDVAAPAETVADDAWAPGGSADASWGSPGVPAPDAPGPSSRDDAEAGQESREMPAVPSLELAGADRPF
jgi:single-strand DNA-binding protein